MHIVEVTGGGTMAVAVDVDVSLAVAVSFIGFGATICTRQQILWSPLVVIFFVVWNIY